MKHPIDQRVDVIKSLVNDEINILKACELLACSRRSIERYREAYIKGGEEALKDHRHSNYRKLSEEDRSKAIELKKKDRWRSARNVRDKLRLKVSARLIGNVFNEEGLTKQNIKAVKPIIRFEAEKPNDMWQTDIMGRIAFPKVGDLYLIATLDDHSRFVPFGFWFKKQNKMNVFYVWYKSMERFGTPKAMLQDEGSQFKARTRFGNADYEWYAKALSIELIWARRAQTKGKIERFWRFVQDDFVREVWNAESTEEVNYRFREWLRSYNYNFKSDYFGGETRSERYKPSERRLSKVELRTLLIVEERRKVSRESTISLYGKHYYVPPGYINCRIWIKILGNKVTFEADGKTFWKTRLKIS